MTKRQKSKNIHSMVLNAQMKVSPYRTIHNERSVLYALPNQDGVPYLHLKKTHRSAGDMSK